MLSRLGVLAVDLGFDSRDVGLRHRVARLNVAAELFCLRHFAKHPQPTLDLRITRAFASGRRGAGSLRLWRGFGDRAASLEFLDEIFAVGEGSAPLLDAALQAVIARNETDLPRSRMRGNQFLDGVVGILARRGKADGHSGGRELPRQTGGSLRGVKNERRPLALGIGQVPREKGDELRAGSLELTGAIASTGKPGRVEKIVPVDDQIKSSHSTILSRPKDVDGDQCADCST